MVSSKNYTNNIPNKMKHTQTLPMPHREFKQLTDEDRARIAREVAKTSIIWDFYSSVRARYSDTIGNPFSFGPELVRDGRRYHQ